MLDKTRGIVLHTVAYSDKMSIAQLYTERFGRASYLLPQSQNRRSRLLRPLFSPFSFLEIDSERQAGQDIFRIREARQVEVWNHLRTDPVKNAVTLFLAEMLTRLFREPEANPTFFDFLVQSIRLFDMMEEGKANFHLWFLFRLTAFLGFFPNTEHYEEGRFFDMMEGVFVALPPTHPHSLSPHEAAIFARLMRMNSHNLGHFRFNRDERCAILEQINRYYRLHQPDLPEIRSLEIMHELFE
ncbi:MAG: DNA repair protein RecO [Porphyromonadaceae bacterium]|nr:DNA repair protein RecO [Porphyromonadaceae bacterium]